MGFLVWFGIGEGQFFIHQLQTALPFEYGPLASFCPVVVLLDEEESAIAFPTKKE